MIRRLQKKFLIAAVSSVFLVLLVLIGSINIINFRSLVEEADETLELLASNDGVFPRQMFREQNLPPEGVYGDDPDDDREDDWEENAPAGVFGMRREEGFRELAYQSRYFAVWYDETGNLARMNLENLISLDEEEASELAQAVYASGKEKGFSNEYRYLRSEGEEETLLLFLNCERELSTFRNFLYASIAISLAGLAAVFLLLLLFSGRIVRPIALSYEKQKRFITDAGHELKTPITIIQADADVLESELEGENEWVTDIRRQTHRLTELTADLIYLSRMEEENPALQMEDFSLSELVEETAQSFQALALSQGKSFRFSVTPGLEMRGDAKAAAKLVSILLDNAMKYSAEDGSVELTLEKSGKNALLIVKNSTIPMEKGSADHLFERFTRADSSRNSKTGGFGLGLAIAKAVTEAHKGKIHAESEDGKSLTVIAELPIIMKREVK